MREKTQWKEFLLTQAGATDATANPNPGVGRNEILIEGIRFHVADGGKKLVKSPGTRPNNEATQPDIEHARLTTRALTDQHLATPKTAVVAGVRFHRTKTGNLVANRIVQDHRYVASTNMVDTLTVDSRSGARKKVFQPCKAFSTMGNIYSQLDRSSTRSKRESPGTRVWACTNNEFIPGSCPKGPNCRYQHDPTKVAICKDYLKNGKCPNGESCDMSHDASPERVPNCLHYAKGHCTNADCPYTHSRAAPGALVCEAFGFYGYCDKGAACSERHVYECPDFSNTGVCKTKGCKLLHRERASVLRNLAKADEAMDEDVSSDEEPADSDDVDSDEVADFIEAESDDSDDENQKDFIRL
jgi:hypothetical protein